jgi:phosphoribulokinase
VPGAFLAWNEHMDKTEVMFLEGICPCGADLHDARDLGCHDLIRQLDRLPVPGIK